MNRKLMLFRILIFILGISLLAGCGGGGGKKQPTEKGPSTDYYGLTVGAKLVYNALETPGNISNNLTYRILSEYRPGIFRTSWAGSDDTDGEFVKKTEDGYYYECGDWETENEDDWNWYEEEDYQTIIKNPITAGSKSDWWGEALRQETVKVPAGTFKAWVFHSQDPYKDDDEIDYIDNDYYWFVPNLGLIKVISTTTRVSDSVITESITGVLQSYSFEANTSSSINQNFSNHSVSSGASSKLRKLFKH